MSGIVARLQIKSEWVYRHSTQAKTYFYSEHRKLTAAHKKSWRCRSRSAFSMQSMSHLFPDTKVSDACTTRYRRRASRRTWGTYYIWRFTTVRHVGVAEKGWIGNDTSIYSLQRDPSTLLLCEYLAHQKTNSGNTFVIVATNRSSELTRPTSKWKTTALHTATPFLDYWIVPSGLPEFLRTVNGSQLLSKLFPVLHGFFRMKHTTTTADHLQRNWKVERKNRMIAERRRHYVTEYRNNWHIFVQPMTNFYNALVHRSIEVSPFSPLLARHLPGAATFDFPLAIPSVLSRYLSPHILRSRVLARLDLRKNILPSIDRGAKVTQIRVR